MDIVIIGNGAAAVSAIETIRGNDQECGVMVVSKEKEAAYTPCFLAEYVRGSIGKERLYMRSSDFYEKNGVKVMSGVSATEVRHESNLVRLSDGGEISYDQLLLAAGSIPVVPSIPGIENDGVFFFKSLPDAERIKTAAKEGRAVVIAGAGFIGLEITESLLEAGLRVTVIEKEERVLPGMLDQEVASFVERYIKEKGVDIITGEAIGSISRKGGKIEQVTLESGKSIPCDMLIVSVGVKPNLEMIRDGRIKTDQGVLVDERMRTDIPNIYAAGDIAEMEIGGKRKINPIHINAVMGGDVAGSNMTGVEKRLDAHIDDMNVVTIFGLPILSLGSQGNGRTLKREGVNSLAKVSLADEGFIKGIQLVGDVTKGGVYLSLMKRRIPIDGISDILPPQFSYGSTLKVVPRHL